MRMGKKKVNKLFSSLGGTVGLKMVISRNRGYSDNLQTQRCSTINSGAAGLGPRFELDDLEENEDCKSEDEMRRVIDDSGSDEGTPSPNK